MPQAITKLFRNPQLAGKAAKELQAHGYKLEEIGLLTLDGEGVKKLAATGVPSKVARLELPALGSIAAMGALASLLTDKIEPKEALIKALGLSEEAYRYYETGLSLGGVLVSVHAEEARLSSAREILRKVEASARETSRALWRHSPGFTKAGRMTQTDTLDEKMSGDFRRY